ncbi:MAG: hypothetical protein V4538_14925 [Bacteroidota bacterium]
MSLSEKDLRIGNYVLAGKMTEPIQVHTIGFELREGSMINTHIPIEHIHPIPLSPEILDKCGFTWYDNDWYETKSKIHLSVELFTGYIYFGKGEYLYKAEIKYLHQLQNLYFALTGTELTYNTNQK